MSSGGSEVSATSLSYKFTSQKSLSSDEFCSELSELSLIARAAIVIIKLRNRLVPLVTSLVIHIVNRKLICCRKSRVFALGASNWQKLIAKSFLEYFFTYKGINLYFWVYMPFKILRAKPCAPWYNAEIDAAKRFRRKAERQIGV